MVGRDNRFWHNSGFTLVEIIGVLAIMAIMAAIILPNVVRQMQAAKRDAEEMNLSILADALENYVMANRAIPQSGFGAGTWATNLATQTDLPVTDVYQNGLLCSRRYWFDPSNDLNGLTDDTAPYDQDTVAIANLSGMTTGAAASAPANPRAMFISDMAAGCTNNINGVADTDANFLAVWDQTAPPLVEGAEIKIERVNLSELFEPVSLYVANSSIFSRRSYSSPAAGNSTNNPLMTLGRHSRAFYVTYSTGGFSPTTPAGGIATISIGTALLTEFVNAASVITGVNSGPVAIALNTGDNTQTVGSTLTIGGAGVTSANSGYMDILVEYAGEPQYQLEGRAGNPNVITITTPGTSELISFNVINGTQLFLYDQDWTAASPTGNLMLSIVLKESDSFSYSPGPPAVWGR